MVDGGKEEDEDKASIVERSSCAFKDLRVQQTNSRGPLTRFFGYAEGADRARSSLLVPLPKVTRPLSKVTLTLFSPPTFHRRLSLLHHLLPALLSFHTITTQVW